MAERFDIVVIGSGAAALMAAARAAVAGASVVVLEKQDRIGGTTARSGGGIWVPNNPFMKDAGVDDSEEEAFEYMRAVIPESQVSDTTIRMYIETVPKMLEFMMSETDAQYVPVPGYADYYPGVPGWKPGCRTMDCLPVDGRKLGEDLYKLQSLPPQSRAFGKVHMSILEGARILAQAPGARRTMASVFLRYYLDISGRLKGRTDRRLTMGNGLIGGLLSALKRLDVPLRLRTPVVELVADRARVTAVISENGNGERTAIEVTTAVIAAAGGFEHNDAMRQQNLPGPTDSAWSAGSAGNTGDLIKAGKAIGAKVGLMNEAWWGPVVRRGRHPVVLFSEKSKPHLIIVDAQGRRFMNESITYNSYGECMYGAKRRGFDCVPAYVIFDGQYRQKYLFAGLPQSKLSPDWMNRKLFGPKGMLQKADTIGELAEKLGVDVAGLEATAERFAGFAKTGVDEDFGRGDDDHDRMYGDHEVGPNPCLGAVEKPPFYGARLYPGDIGTKGGLVIDDDARVLRDDGSPINGLYAAGNCTASIMGDKYPGAGCTIGPALTMAYRAANHATGLEA